MLVLSRKINKRILIGECVRITVVATRGNQVRIGIEAPDDVPIFREELLRPAGDSTVPTTLEVLVDHPLVRGKPDT